MKTGGSIKKCLSLILTVFLILSMDGCQRQGEMDLIYYENISSNTVISSEAVTAKAMDELSGTLTLKIQDDFYWKYWIASFESAYPNVTIEIAGQSEDAEAYVQQTMVELMSGSLEYDLLDLCSLPIYRCAENFEDLLSYIEIDENISIDELYGGIVSASTLNEQIAAIPLAFNVTAFRVNPFYIDASTLENSQVNFNDLYQPMQAANNFDLLMIENNNNTHVFFQTELLAHMNEQTKETTVNTPEFIDFLKK